MMSLFSRASYSSVIATIKAHRLLGAGIVVVCVIASYWFYGTYLSASATTTYVLGTVEKGTIVASVSASGQVSASNQLDIKPRVSGELLSVLVVAGQKVSAGQLIAVIDPSSAQKTVRDAEVNVQSAQLSLDKIQQPADALSLIQAQDALAQASTTLAKAYDDGFNDVSNAFLSLPGDMDGLKNILYGYDATPSKSQSNISAYADMVDSSDPAVIAFKQDAATKYQSALDAYNAAFLAYRALSRASDVAAIEHSISQTYDTIKRIADATKSANDFLGLVKGKLTDKNQPIPTTLTTHMSALGTYISDTGSHLDELLNIKNTITSSEYSIAERTQSLSDLHAGATPLDIQSAKLTLQQRQNALADAQSALADYYVRAPFSGIIASVNAKKYDTAGSGSVIATLITDQQMAELSLNEVDAAKVTVGNKATVTFDAIDTLTMTGKVAEINTIGTVSQGVVSYAVRIGFDAQDARIKPGMTANAAIQTEVHQDVLMVPSSAVKTKNDANYVLVFDPALSAAEVAKAGSTGIASSVAPKQVPVQTGIADDTNIEIVSGLSEGQQIIIRSTSASAKTTTTSSTSSTRNALGGGPGIRL